MHIPDSPSSGHALRNLELLTATELVRKARFGLVDAKPGPAAAAAVLETLEHLARIHEELERIRAALAPRALGREGQAA